MAVSRLLSMRLHSLELAGFKSFGKKTTLEFSAPIVAIVGPNGSGKSNIAEAFRFVLGEQSIKSLRGKRGEDLIFNGSRSAPRANRASVKVRFENHDRLFPVDFDELSLERVIHRDSTSEYLVNGSTVRLKDSMELLAAGRIGASGHHIIAQGEADRILHASPKERRAMLEDALGLKLFQYKKEESQKKLLKTKENITSVQSLRKEIEPHLRFLKRQMEKLKRAQGLREELLTLSREYFLNEDVYLKESKRRVALEGQAPRTDIAELEGELARAKALLSQSEPQYKQDGTEGVMEETMRAVRSKRELLARDLGRIEGALAALSHDVPINEDVRPTLPQRDTRMLPVAKLETLVEEVSVAIEAVEQEESPSRLKGLLHDITGRLRRLLGEYAIQKEGMSPRRERPNLSLRRGELEGEAERLREESAALSREEEELTQARTAFFLKREQEKDARRDVERQIFSLTARLSEAHGRLEALRTREERLLHEEEDFKRDLGEAAALVGHALLSIFSHDGHPQEQATDGVLSPETRTLQDNRRRAIERMKIRLEEAGAGGGEEVLKEYEEVQNRDMFLSREIDDLEQSAASLATLIGDLEKRLDVQFKEGMQTVNTQFQEFFGRMFGGGQASLSIVRETRRRRGALSEEGEEISENSDEESTEGIGIEITLPHKRVKGLEALSGGERALTSIALLFAISQVNPPPFIILDETDAALDEANSKRYADMIELLSKHSQLIVITHNRETMSRAGILYGVTMGSDALSQLLSVRFDEAVAVAK